MKKIDLWVKDMLSQRFNNNDATRLIILSFLIKDGVIKSEYKKEELFEYVYRVYADYPETAKSNPFSVIRQINYFTIKDIVKVIDNAFEEWDLYAQTDILKYDNNYVFFRCDDLVNSYLVTKSIIEMYKNKNIKFCFGEPKQCDAKEMRTNDGIYMDGIFKSRVLEDMQFCPVCEEIKLSELCAVHILPIQYCTEDSMVTDKNNGLILCKKHAQQYLNEEFIFLENGFLKNIISSERSEKSHLNLNAKNICRRNYLKQNYLRIKDKIEK